MERAPGVVMYKVAALVYIRCSMYELVKVRPAPVLPLSCLFVCMPLGARYPCHHQYA